jgi:hypothetical protein
MKFPRFTFKNPLKKKAARVAEDHEIRDIDYRVLSGALTELNQIRLTAAQLQERRTSYNAMAQLQSDAVMGPTFEVYATNATPANADGHVIWAVAVDKTNDETQLAAEAVNALLQHWELDWRAYKHIYEMVCYGNLYLKTTEYVTPNSGVAVINLNERNPNKHWDLLPGSAISPSDIYELAEDGECVGFVNEGVTNEYQSYCRIEDQKWAVQSTDAVIHFIYNPSLYAREIDVEDEGGTTSYQVVEGDPPFISAYTPAQILSLLEDALVANRVTRSALVRILQVEVGDCSPQEEDRTLDKLQRALETKLAMSTAAGATQSYADPGPLEKVIYTATRNGKGVINLQTLGGDVNVRDIVDLDYFKDKLTSITDVSPGNLGQSTDESGSGGATILTQNNIRLYRKIVSLQHCYIAGITRAVNLYFEKNGLDRYIDKFEIKMQKPLGPEDELRSQLAGDALQRANDIVALLENLGITDSRVKIRAIKAQLDTIDAKIYSVITADPVTPDDEEGEADGSDLEDNSDFL